jgi:hypothetical protein
VQACKDFPNSGGNQRTRDATTPRRGERVRKFCVGRVSVRRRPTGQTTGTKSDSQGNHRFNSLTPSLYAISASAEGVDRQGYDWSLTTSPQSADIALTTTGPSLIENSEILQPELLVAKTQCGVSQTSS